MRQTRATQSASDIWTFVELWVRRGWGGGKELSPFETMPELKSEPKKREKE
jgi:hypothetical protein